MAASTLQCRLRYTLYQHRSMFQYSQHDKERERRLLPSIVGRKGFKAEADNELSGSSEQMPADKLEASLTCTALAEAFVEMSSQLNLFCQAQLASLTQDPAFAVRVRILLRKQQNAHG